MEITLQRTVARDDSTSGELLGLEFPCFTIERPLVSWDGGYVAIQEGRFKLTKYFSPSHGFNVALFNDVPGRSAIEIHPANWASQLKGCVGVGLVAGTLGDPAQNIPPDTPAVISSQAAFTKVMAAFGEAWQRGEDVWCAVRNPGTPIADAPTD